MSGVRDFSNILKFAAVVAFVVNVPARAADRIVIGAGETGTLGNQHYNGYESDTENGGVFSNAGTLGIDFGAYVSGNSAVAGGAIWNLGTINTAQWSSGYINFYNNHATGGDGGALYNNTGAAVNNLSHVLFQKNTAAGNGGAVYNNGVINSISAATFAENDAKETGAGGAIWNGGTLDSVADSLFMQNYADIGGAINNTANIGNIIGTENSETGIRFVNNMAINGDSQNGGAIANSGNIGLIDNATFSSNQAGKNGGAIYNVGNNATITIADAHFVGNVAGTSGGAIYNGENQTVNLTGTVSFVGNQAGEAANDIYNDGIINIQNGAEVKIGSGINGNGTLGLESGGVLDIGTSVVEQGKINLGGDVHMSAITTGAYGQIHADVINTGTGKIELSVGSAGTYDLFSGDVGEMLEYNTALFDMSTENDGKLTFTTKSPTEIAENENLTLGAAAVVVGLANADTYSMGVASLNVQQALADDNIQYIEQEAGRLQANDLPVAQSVVNAVRSTLVSIADGRMHGNLGRARSAGDDARVAYGVWGHGTFNQTKFSDEFTANMRGISVGADALVGKKFTIGAGYAYNKSDVDSGARDTDVENNTVFVYGQYQPGKWYINAILDYTMSNYTDVSNAFGLVFETEYDAYAFGGQIMTGYDFEFGLSPEIGVRYLYLGQDEYENILSSVDVGDTDFLTGILGARYAFGFDFESGLRLGANLRAAATYDVLSDAAVATVAIPNATTYQVDGRALDAFGGEFGVGVGVVYDGWDISINYNLAMRSDYTSHTGMLEFRYDF